MTGKEVFLRAAAFLAQNETDASDSIAFAPAWINVCLQECLEVENQRRRIDGMKEIQVAPVVTEDNMETMQLGYHTDIENVALPYGVAVHLWREDDNDYRANLFQTLYANAITEALRMEEQDITDVYS